MHGGAEEGEGGRLELSMPCKWAISPPTDLAESEEETAGGNNGDGRRGRLGLRWGMRMRRRKADEKRSDEQDSCELHFELVARKGKERRHLQSRMNADAVN